MQLTVYNDEVLPYDADRQGRQQDSAVLSETCLELKSVLFRNENRDSFVLERGVREEKDDRLEALLRAEVAMVPRLTAAPGELADGSLQARDCFLGIGEGGRLVGPLPGLFKLEGAAGGESISADGGVPKGSRGRGFKTSALRL